MTTLEKAARAMAEKLSEQQFGSEIPWHDPEFRQNAIECAVAAISAALLDPSDEVVAYSLAAMIGTLWAAGWAETELRKIPKGALQTAFEEGLRAAGVKITGSQE